jgi:DMSO/TMAO reductase YedYZ heme-binding membrane subunit
LPAGWWLKIHRFSLVILIAAWLHGLQSGTDSQPFLPIYIGIGAVVVVAAAYRYWVVRRARSAGRLPVGRERPTAEAQIHVVAERSIGGTDA